MSRLGHEKGPATSAGMAVEVEQLDSAAAPKIPRAGKNMFKIIVDITIYIYIITYIYIYIYIYILVYIYKCIYIYISEND